MAWNSPHSDVHMLEHFTLRYFFFLAGVRFIANAKVRLVEGSAMWKEWSVDGARL